MKNKKIFLLFACTFFLLGSGFLAGCDNEFFRFVTRPKPTVTQKQIDYLKKHQDEIKDFIKSLNSKIESVQIDWSQTRASEGGNGTPQGGGEYISVYGTFNNLEASDWEVVFEVKEGKIDINSMAMHDGLRLDGDYFE